MAGETDVQVSRSIRIGGLTIGGVGQTIPADKHVAIKKTVPKNSTNIQFDVAADISDAVGMAIEASQDCTVYTNDLSTGTPTDTLSLKKNVPVLWSLGDPVAAKFLSADVTAVYVTTGSEDTKLAFAVAEDVTPAF